jgi:hypothetical protein
MRSLSLRRLGNGVSLLLTGGLLNLVAFQALRVSPEKLALFAAFAIAAEALQRREHELLPDALGGERFSLTSPIQIAALIVAGPWVAAAVAGWSVVSVGLFREFDSRKLLLSPLPPSRAGWPFGWPAESSESSRCRITCCRPRSRGSCT